MNDFRLQKMVGYDRGQPISLTIDGNVISAFEGETVGAVMLAEGCATLRHTRRNVPRGIYCGMGLCYDCLVTVDGAESLRACMTPVANAMVVETSQREPDVAADGPGTTHGR